MTTPINYAVPERTTRWPRRAVVRGVAALAVLLALLAIPAQAVRQRQSRMDAVTGSMEWTTTGPLGAKSGPTVYPSDLEKRLVAAGIAWNRDWRFLHNTQLTLFGNATAHECGSAPPIYQMQSILKDFANASTDAELREFVRIMQTGTPAEQTAAVDAAAEKGLAAMAAGR